MDVHQQYTARYLGDTDHEAGICRDLLSGLAGGSWYGPRVCLDDGRPAFLLQKTVYEGETYFHLNGFTGGICEYVDSIFVGTDLHIARATYNGRAIDEEGFRDMDRMIYNRPLLKITDVTDADLCERLAEVFLDEWGRTDCHDSGVICPDVRLMNDHLIWTRDHGLVEVLIEADMDGRPCFIVEECHDRGGYDRGTGIYHVMEIGGWREGDYPASFHWNMDFYLNTMNKELIPVSDTTGEGVVRRVRDFLFFEDIEVPDIPGNRELAVLCTAILDHGGDMLPEKAGDTFSALMDGYAGDAASKVRYMGRRLKDIGIHLTRR